MTDGSAILSEVVQGISIVFQKVNVNSVSCSLSLSLSLSHSISLLTHICRMDLSILIIWTSPFRILGVSDLFYHLYLILDRKSFKQTV